MHSSICSRFHLKHGISLFLGVTILFGCAVAPSSPVNDLKQTIVSPVIINTQQPPSTDLSEMTTITPSPTLTPFSTPQETNPHVPTPKSTIQAEINEDNWTIAFTALIIDDPTDPARFNHYEAQTIQINSNQTFRLVQNGTFSWIPKWSPDGERIAFLSIDQQVSSLNILDTRTGHIEMIENVWGFDWSRDGQAIAYCEQGNWPFGQENPFHCFLAVIGDLSQPRQLVAVDWHASELHWSPTDDRILVLAERQVGADRIYMIHPDGQIQEIPTQKDPWKQVAWDPSGEKIIYSPEPDLSFLVSSELREINLQTMEEHELTRTGEIVGSFQFSPNGKMLAYESSPVLDLHRSYPPGYSPITYLIHILNLETGETINIADHQLNMFYPVWSPNGEFLAYLEQTSPWSEEVLGRDYSLNIYRIETGTTMTLVPQGVWLIEPDWKP